MIDLVFSKILAMSVTGSIAIAVVIALRSILAKRDKTFVYALWLVVLFRLICPFSLSGRLSLYNAVGYAGENARIEYSFVPQAVAEVTEKEEKPVQTEINDESKTVTAISLLDIAAAIWLIGAAGFAVKNLSLYHRLKSKLEDSEHLYGNVYRNEIIDSAFVTGYLAPKIYLPAGLTDSEENIIVAHETEHILCGHHITKFAGFVVLCLHWFNPVVWYAYSLLEKDMEMMCDEKVIKRLSASRRADYSKVLLSVSARKSSKYLRLAFGENEVKERVVNILKYKKPTVLRCAVAGIVVLAAAVALVLNPTQKYYVNDIHVSLDNSTSAGFYFETPELISGSNFDDKKCHGNLIKYVEGYDKTGDTVCWVSCYKYEVAEGEEDNPDAIYSQLWLSSARVVDTNTENYRIIKSDEYGHTAVTKIYYGDGKENNCILVYNRDAKVFVMVEFDSEKVSEKLVNKIAQTVKLERVDFMLSEYPDSGNSEIDETSLPLETPEIEGIKLSFTMSDLLQNGENYFITRGFTGQYADGGHSGIDIAAPYDTPIKSLEDGVVTEAYYTSTGYGIYIAIDHGDYVTHYSHCSRLGENIQMGDTVKKGDVIAYVGSTGNSTGNHLHLEVKKKSDESGLSSGYTYLDPKLFIKN